MSTESPHCELANIEFNILKGVIETSQTLMLKSTAVGRFEFRTAKQNVFLCQQFIDSVYPFMKITSAPSLRACSIFW